MSSDITRFRRRSLWISAARITILSYLGLLLWMGYAQRSYLYYPERLPYSAAINEARQRGLQPWMGNDGVLWGWMVGPANPTAQRALVLHGNAGWAGDRVYFADALAARPGGMAWEVFILEYPGYGARPGKPAESAFRKAARDALDHLIAERPDPVVIIGESIGSGVACQLAADRPHRVAGLLLITPFTSLTDVAAHHYPFLPVRLFLRDRYKSAEALRDYGGPVVFVIAERDEVVPARFGRALYEGYAGPKRIYEQADRTHNTLDLDPASPWWNAAMRFILEEAGSDHREVPRAQAIETGDVRQIKVNGGQGDEPVFQRRQIRSFRIARGL